METINVIPLPGAQFLNYLSWLKFNRNILCKILYLSEKLIMNVKSRIYSFTMNLHKKISCTCEINTLNHLKQHSESFKNNTVNHLKTIQ